MDSGVDAVDCAPQVSATWVALRLADPAGAFESVRIGGDSALTRGGRPLVRVGDVWTGGFDRPDLARIEYQFVGRLSAAAGGGTRWLTDPCNPLSVQTAFGRHSVLELPGYTAPAWTAAEGIPGRYDRFELPAGSGELGEPLPVAVWSPADSTGAEPLPMLLVHDGPEYDELAALTRFSAVQVARSALPRHRVALLQPVRRAQWYSASQAYLRTETGPLLRLLRERYAVSGPLAVMGASLGGLTAVLAGLHQPGSDIGAVFSQSGSFFQPAHDQQERGYDGYGPICAAVGEVLAGTRGSRPPLTVAMTCGALEENAANNRDMAAALRRSGHRVTLHEVRDLHSYTAWRDGLDPALTSLLRDCWAAPG